MLLVVIAIVVASIFHYVGNNEHVEKGGMLALLSILCSVAGLFWWGLRGLFILNGLLYISIFIYNLFSKRPPSSRSGS